MLSFESYTYLAYQERRSMERNKRIHERDNQFEKDVHTLEQKVEEVNQILFNLEQTLEQWKKASMKRKVDEIQSKNEDVKVLILEDLAEIESIYPFEEESLNPKKDEILLNYDDLSPIYDEYDDEVILEEEEEPIELPPSRADKQKTDFELDELAQKKEETQELDMFSSEQVDFVFGDLNPFLNNKENLRTNFFEEWENDVDPRRSKLGFKHDDEPQKTKITWLSQVGLYWPRLGCMKLSESKRAKKEAQTVQLCSIGPIEVGPAHSTTIGPIEDQPLQNTILGVNSSSTSISSTSGEIGSQNCPSCCFWPKTALLGQIEHFAPRPYIIPPQFAFL